MSLHCSVPTRRRNRKSYSSKDQHPSPQFVSYLSHLFPAMKLLLILFLVAFLESARSIPIFSLPGLSFLQPTSALSPAVVPGGVTADTLNSLILLSALQNPSDLGSVLSLLLAQGATGGIGNAVTGVPNSLPGGTDLGALLTALLLGTSVGGPPLNTPKAPVPPPAGLIPPVSPPKLAPIKEDATLVRFSDSEGALGKQEVNDAVNTLLGNSKGLSEINS